MISIVEATKPYPLHQNLSDLLNKPKILENVQEYIGKLKENNYKLIEFRLNLLDIKDLNLTQNFLEDPDKFLDAFREELYKRIRHDREIKQNFKIKSHEYLHVIVDIEDLNLENRIIKDFSKDLTPYLKQYCIFYGRFLNLKLDKVTQYLKLKFECKLCGASLEKTNNLRCEKDLIPTIHTNESGNVCQNKQFDASDILEKETIEHGTFKLGDPELTNFKYTLPCKIFRNLDYFVQKVENININEDVKVIGILRTDETDIFYNRKKIKHRYRKYIEVIDIVSERTHKIDEEIIKVLKEKINDIPQYREMLIDAIFPFTFEVDIFFRPKLTLALSYVSGGCWTEDYRQTINAIIGSGGSTFKSSMCRFFCNTIDDRNVLFFENRKITRAGLYGTTKRNNETGDVEVVHGVLALYSDGTIIFDEAQELDYDILADLRCLEKGDTGGIQDALTFNSPAKESALLIQNFVKKQDGFFDSQASIVENLGWKKENAKSLLERFDLFCIIPKPDRYIQKYISANERREDNDLLIKDIYSLLEIEDFSFPRFITKEKQKLRYVIKNFLWKSKELFRETNISENYKNSIRDVYDQILEENYQNFTEDFDINQRAKNSCYKVLMALASLRLDNEVNEGDFELFKLKCMNLITAFQDSRIFNTSEINMDELFIESFKDLAKTKILYKIPISEHINYFRSYIKRQCFNDFDFEIPEDLNLSKKEKLKREMLIEETEKKIDQIVNRKTSLSKNYRYRVLLKNNEAKLNELEYYREVINNKTYLVKELEEDLYSRKDYKIIVKIQDEIEEIYECGKNKAIPIKAVIEGLSLHFPELSPEQILDYIELLKIKGKITKIIEEEE